VVSDDALGSNGLGLIGADAGSFEIVGTQLRLKAGVLDYEAKSHYDIEIKAHEASIETKKKELEAVRLKYEGDKRRYVELSRRTKLR